MIVFDVDGTLIGGERADWASYDAAFKASAGFALDAAFFATLEEVTAQAIVHKALAMRTEDERRAIERAVCAGFLAGLTEVHRQDAAAFPAAPGALALLARLRAEGIPVAIATGDWRETILFKLGAAGIDVAGLQVVTSSEFYSRADIIAAAVERTGGTLAEAIYVGDGPWDLRATQKLGIPFIGVGRRQDRLRAAGAVHLPLDLHPENFWPAMHAARSR